MAVNRDKPDRWKEDVAKLVEFYNEWFLEFAPKTFREERIKATNDVEDTIDKTSQLRKLNAKHLYDNPNLLYVLRMCTAPPIARDRLIGLSGVRKHLIGEMEKKGEIPPTYDKVQVLDELESVVGVLKRLLDATLFEWVKEDRDYTDKEEHIAATVVADRLTGAVSDPIIRNAQEERQLGAITKFLEQRGYCELEQAKREHWQDLPPGTYAKRMNVPTDSVNVPVDIAIQPTAAEQETMLVEAKSAGDFTNTNKRRKEEAEKVHRLRNSYGEEQIEYVLFLCGYFDCGYLGYEAGEKIDWVWEHRIRDFEEFGI